MASNSSSESSDEEILEFVRVFRPRIFRDRFNPMDQYDELEFKRRFRLSKIAIRNLAERIGDNIKPVTMRSRSISATLQLIICLRFLATGSFQIMLGDDIRIHRTTISRIITKVLPHIASLREEYVKMPTTPAEMAKVASEFQEIAGFPKVFGCIDGTHIPIQSPGGNNAEIYRCRKGFFSYNVQIVCDSKFKILDIVARWPGSTHDSTVFNNSLLKIQCENNEFPNFYLLADAAYAASNYMLTPLANIETNAERRYQRAHTVTRCTVERTIGIWKRRFSAMSRQLRIKKETALIAIVASAVLHNMSLEEGMDQEFEINEQSGYL